MRSPRSLRLADGRRLAWYEFGDPVGVACLYFPGTPTSGLIGEVYDEAARACGIRLIALDKPGYGHSDYAPRRRLTDIAADIAALAGYCGLESLPVIGESGGAPHALAVAAELTSLVPAAAVVAGIGPVTPAELADMTSSTRLLMRLARRSPWAARVAFAPTRLALRSPRASARAQAMATHAPPADRRVLQEQPHIADLAVRAAAEAVRRDSRAVAQELAWFARPWGFAPSALTVPVDVWHGAQDGNVPVAVARRLATEVPGARLHLVADAGHSVGLVVADQMFAALHDALSTRPASSAATD